MIKDLQLSTKKTVFIVLVFVFVSIAYYVTESSKISVLLKMEKPPAPAIKGIQTSSRPCNQDRTTVSPTKKVRSGKGVRTIEEQQIEAIEILSLAVESAVTMNKKLLDNGRKCDFTDGIWVNDTSIKRGEGVLKGYLKCHVDTRQNCLRRNVNAKYLGYRWVLKDANCEAKRVRFTRELFLSTVRNKSIVFIGDSLTRNMFQSLACLLYVPGDKEKMIESNQYKYRYPDFGVNIEFIVSNFLVHQTKKGCDSDAKRYGLAKEPCLDVNNVDQTWASRVKDFDIFMFATGGWWEHDIEMRQVIGTDRSYRKSRSLLSQALVTVMNYLARPEFKKKELYWRCSEVSHFFGGEWNSGGKCVRNAASNYPIYNSVSLFIQEAVIDSLSKTLSNITLLDITKMSSYRQDAHPASQAKFSGATDCKHWCLPGVTDHWNELWMNMMRNETRNI